MIKKSSDDFTEKSLKSKLLSKEDQISKSILLEILQSINELKEDVRTLKAQKIESNYIGVAQLAKARGYSATGMMKKVKNLFHPSELVKHNGVISISVNNALQIPTKYKVANNV